MRLVKRLFCLGISVVLLLSCCAVICLADNGATEIMGDYGSVSINDVTYYYNSEGRLFYSVGGDQVRDLTVIDAAQQLLRQNNISVKLTVSEQDSEDAALLGINVDAKQLYYGFNILIPVYYCSEVPDNVTMGPSIEFADAESCEKLEGTLLFISNGKTKNEKISIAIWYESDANNEKQENGIVSAYVLLAAKQARDIIKKGVYLPEKLFIGANGQLYYEMSNSYLPLAPEISAGIKDDSVLRFNPICITVRISAWFSVGLTANDEIRQNIRF